MQEHFVTCSDIRIKGGVGNVGQKGRIIIDLMNMQGYNIQSIEINAYINNQIIPFQENARRHTNMPTTKENGAATQTKIAMISR